LFFVRKNSRRTSTYIFVFYKKIKGRINPSEQNDVNQQLILQLSNKKIPNWSQVKQLPKFLNRAEKFNLSTALIVLVLAIGIFGWRLYIKSSIAIPDFGGSYTEGLIGAPHLVNPILASSDVDRDLVKLIFSGLMKFNEQGNLVPDLASSYTIDAEQTTYTFELRDNLRWHDDEPITVDDIIFTIDSIKNPDYNSPLKNSFSGVTIQRINDKTIQFNLEKPFSPFLSILTTGIVPEHLWYSVPAFSASLTDLNTKPIGSGPYSFSSLIRDTSGNIKNYTLEAYEGYHLPPAFISELHFKFYPDFFTGVSALENKNIDGLIYLPKEFKDQIDTNKVSLHNLQFPQFTAVFFNPKNNELLSDKKFRQALAVSINKERVLTEVLNGDGQIIHTPILPGLLGYDSELKAPEYSPEQAAVTLDELGWKMPEEGSFRTKASEEEDEDPIELSIKLTTIDQSENVKIVNIIKEAWEEIGIKIDLEIVSKEKIKKNVIEPRDYQVLVFGEVVNINSGPYPFWHSSQNQHPGLNLSLLANKDIDKHLEDVRAANIDENKLEPLKNFQEKLLELNFAIFLYNPTYIYPTTDKLQGLDDLQFINLPADRFNNVNSWFVKTRRTFSQ
jgi:peptide/nickel transport system substrate-binding protein